MNDKSIQTRAAFYVDENGNAHPLHKKTFTQEDNDNLIYECKRLLIASKEDDKNKDLLDQFALAAMQGDWASESRLSGSYEYVARKYYEMADAMMKVRGEK